MGKMKYNKSGIICLAAFLICAIMALGVSAETYVDKIKIPKLNDPEMPDIETVELNNGIKLYIIEDHELPLINARVRIAAGSYLDPLDMIGLAEITGEVMRTGGTKNMTGDDIDEKLESIGASVETSLGTTDGSARMNILAEYADVGLGVLADVLRNPVFDEDKIDLAKTSMRSEIARRNDDAWQICIREARKKIYGDDSPYARNTEYATVNGISRDDLIAFHDKYIVPENVMIAVWGDFDKKEMIAKMNEYFGDWKTGMGASPEPPKVDYEFKPETYFIDKSNINQSKILIGHIGGLITDPHYYASIVMNNILGASFGSRLFNEVRSKKGLAYAVGGSYTSSITHKGLYYNYCFTKSESTVDAIKAIIAEIKRMQQEKVTDEELKVGKDAYLNSFVFNFESKGEIIGMIMNYDYHGLPRDLIFEEKKKVEQVTADDVLAAAKAVLHPEALKIMVVANGDELTGSLGDFGPVDTLDISIPTGEEEGDMEITAEMLSMGKEMMMKAVNACGGVDNFKKVNSTKTVSTMTLFTPQGEFAINAESINAFPDKSRDVMNTPMGAMISVRNGNDVWVKQGPQVVTGGDEELTDQKKDIFRNMIVTFQHLNDSDYQFAYLGSDELNGTLVEMIQVQSPDGVMKYKLMLDAMTFKPVARMYFGNTMMGPANLTAFLSDYKKVGGVEVPHEIKIESDGNPMASIAIKEFSINVPLEDGMFAKPE